MRLAPQEGQDALEAAPGVGALGVESQGAAVGQHELALSLARQDRPQGRMLAFGTDDAFMHEVGSTDYARKKFGLTAENIAAQVEAALRAGNRR